MRTHLRPRQSIAEHRGRGINSRLEKECSSNMCHSNLCRWIHERNHTMKGTTLEDPQSKSVRLTSHSRFNADLQAFVNTNSRRK